jgi:hypothetical protein
MGVRQGNVGEYSRIVKCICNFAGQIYYLSKGEGMMNETAIIVLTGTALSIFLSLKQRRRFPFPQNLDFDVIPRIFKDEVQIRLDDGYNLASVTDQSVIMVKHRHFVFPWVLMFLNLLPLIVAFNSWYHCGIYCLRIRLVDDEIEVGTF